MGLSRNVQQQNKETKAVIRREARSFAEHPESFSWLTTLLEAHRFGSTTGILARLSSVPEQDGDWYTGVWVTRTREFFEFAVTVSRTDGSLLEVDSFGNVTSS